MKRFLKFIGRLFIVLFILLNIITAFQAYKFTHFYNPEEIVTISNDDKSGWDKTKEILFGINVAKRTNTVVADSSFETIYLNTKDNVKLQGWYLKTGKPARGTVVMFHGHGSTKSAIFLESEEFRKMGYNTLLMDFRAHGSSGGNTTTVGFFESEDVKLAYDFVKNKGEKNIVLWGISMGAATITKAINDYELQPNKIILEMPFGSILKAAEGRIKMMHVPAEPLATLITFWGGVEHGFWAFNMKPTEFAKKINCPVLVQWGKHDPRVTEGEIDMIYANITTPKKLVVFETAAHESLCKKENDKWMIEVQSFLNN